MKSRKIYTTGQIARLLGVAPRTAAMLIDKRHIVGYRIPGSNGGLGDRRVTHAELVAFARRQNIHLPFTADGHTLWMGQGGCDDLFALAAAVVERRWEAVVLDLALVPADMHQRTIDQVRAAQPGAFLVLVVPEDGTRPTFRGLGKVLFAPISDAAIRQLIDAETGGVE